MFEVVNGNVNSIHYDSSRLALRTIKEDDEVDEIPPPKFERDFEPLNQNGYM